jgi:lytic murein transglycosylase
MCMRRALAFVTALVASLAITGTVFAAPACQNKGSFEQWLDAFKNDAATQGIPHNIISQSLAGVSFDSNVISRDRAQGVFQQSFLEFAGRMVSNYRLVQGGKLMKQHEALFARIEGEFGVPASAIVAFWGLESDFGSNNGKFNVIRSLASLAYDCRRPDFFRPQLMDALRIIQRGDLRVSEMIGDWAGELGPLQITASAYYQTAVDYDGDGKRNAITSVPDTLASAANFLKSFGWRAAEPWLQEVRVPVEMPWEQADLAIQHPRSQWVRWGVRSAHGQALPDDDMPASLVLPMGHLGPAFLAYNNFKAFLGWNAAIVYSTTAAYNATRLVGAPPVGRGNGTVQVLTTQQVQDLQRLLIQHQLLAGEADGRLGSATRASVRQAQLKVRLSADAYPTQELINRLRGRNY